MRLRHALPLAAVLLVTTSCITFTTLIKVKPDGSGTLIQTTTMSAEIVNQLKAMTSELEEGSTKTEESEMFSEADAKANAEKLGEGVSFVSMEPIETKEAVGMKATYSFTDITKLTISQQPEDKPSAGPTDESEPAEEVTFRLAKNDAGHTVLTAVFPAPDFGDEGEEEEGSEEADATGLASPEQLAQMKEIFQGMKFGLAIEVDGKLLKTNSPYVEGSTITLMEMDFGALVSNEDALTKLAANPKPTMEEAKGLLKGIEGIKVNLEPEISIEFK